MEENNRIELSPIPKWAGFQVPSAPRAPILLNYGGLDWDLNPMIAKDIIQNRFLINSTNP